MRERQLDQFYTNKNISKKLLTKIDSLYGLNNFFLLEPSAGNGSFSEHFHKDSIAFDIDPKKTNIIQNDFLLVDKQYFSHSTKPIFTIGNPPFGKNSSLAIKFFNKAAEFSEHIAFILPKSFKKESVINKLNNHFHCVYEEDIEDNAFVFNGKKYDVPCVFQIWEKRDYHRISSKLKTTTQLFTFSTKDNADIAVRRVGGLAGKLIMDFINYQPPSHYYLKINNDINKDKVIQIISDSYNELQQMAKNTAGNPSLSKGELISVVEKYYFD